MAALEYRTEDSDAGKVHFCMIQCPADFANFHDGQFRCGIGFRSLEDLAAHQATHDKVVVTAIDPISSNPGGSNVVYLSRAEVEARYPSRP